MSTVSIAEIAIKRSARKLALSGAETLQGIEDLHLALLPYRAEHAFTMFDLPLLHRDPCDRQIIAQALAEGLPIVTSDRTFRLYPRLKLIW